MDLITGLQDLNLSEREAEVYVALLEEEMGTPLSIANKTGLKRPTVYLVLESLRQKRLAGLTFKGKKTYYTAEPPSRFLRYLDEDKQTAMSLLPHLNSLVSHPSGKPEIRYYDRQDDIEEVWYAAADSVQYYEYISNSMKWLERFKHLVDYRTARLKADPTVGLRGLIAFDLANTSYLKYVRDTNRQIRVLPKGYQVNYNVELYGNTAALYSFEHKYMLVITDNTLVSVFKALFSVAWDASMTPAIFLKKFGSPTRKTMKSKRNPIIS
jgi:sugar-specific transcriptional regulator TrmB